MAETPTTTQSPATAEADPGTDDKDQKQDTTLDPKTAGGRDADDEIEPPPPAGR